MSKRPLGDDHMEQQLNSLVRQQEHLDKQLSHILRLIQGDTSLNTLRPTGLLSNVKEIDERLKDMQRSTQEHLHDLQKSTQDKLEEMQRSTHEIVEWWNDRSKRKYIINVDLVAWGKVIAWTIATIAGLVGLVRWINGSGPK